jgi:glutamine synthetase adenylyltransferase
MAREILSKRDFFDFESPDSAISRFPMTLMKLFQKYNFLSFLTEAIYLLQKIIRIINYSLAHSKFLQVFLLKNIKNSFTINSQENH